VTSSSEKPTTGRNSCSAALCPYNPLAKAHYDRGWKEGWKEGWKQGWEEGRREGRAESILLIVEARGLGFDEADRERITSCTDLRLLTTWVKRSVTVEKASELFA
jgi:hypothetical protein